MQTFKVDYFTAPHPSPSSINDNETMEQSLIHTLPHIIPLLSNHSGFLVACYSAHPLVPALKAQTNKPVIGIFEASITTSLLLLRPGERWGIVSTGDVWQELLTNGVQQFLGSVPGTFAGVATTGLNATELHTASAEVVQERMRDATQRLIHRTRADGLELGVVCLGCAGMVGMETLVRKACVAEVGQEAGDKVRIVDGVKAGVKLLEQLTDTWGSRP